MSTSKILLIEDDLAWRPALEKEIEQAGLDVESHASGQAGLEAFRANPGAYQLVLLDWVLPPPVSGEHCLFQVRKADAHLPVVVITGDTEQAGTQATSLGATRYFRKRSDFTELITGIKELLEQEVLLRQIANTFKSLMNCDLCLLYRYQPRQEYLRLSAWAGEPTPDAELRKATLPVRQYPELMQLLLNNQVAFYAAEQAWPGFLLRQPDQSEWKDIQVVPLRHREKIIALIAAFSKQGWDYGAAARQRVRQMLNAYASLAAESIAHNHQHRQNQELFNFGKVLGGQNEPGKLAEAILAKAMRLVEAERGCFYHASVEKKTLRLEAHQPPEARRPAYRMPFGQGLAGAAAAQGVPQMIHDASGYCPVPPLFSRDHLSQVAVPLRRGDLTLGVIALGCKAAHAFSDDERALLQSLSDLASPALDQARLNSHLLRISQAVLGGQGPRKLEEMVIRAIYELTGKPVALWLVNPEGSQARVSQFRGMQHPTQYRQLPPAALDEPGSSLISYALHTRQPVNRTELFEPGKTPFFRDVAMARLEGWQAVLIVPFFDSEGRPLGSMNLYSSQQQGFSDAEVEFISGFASQVAVSFENHQRRQGLLRLVESGKLAARGITSEQEVLQRFVKMACELTGAPCAVVYPYDPEQKIWFDIDKIAAHGLKKRKVVSRRPRQRGLASIIRYTGQFVAHDLGKGWIENIDWEALREFEDIDEVLLHKIVQQQLSPVADSFIQREEIKAFIGISLRATETGDEKNGEREVGVLYINYRNPHHFTTSEINTIQIFAQQIADRIRAARLWELSQTLERASHALTQANEVDEILCRLFQEAFLFAGQVTGEILAVEKNNRLRIVDSIGVSPTQLDEFHQIESYEGSSFAKVMQDGQIFESADTTKSLEKGEMVDLKLPMPGKVTNLPVKAGGKVVAILVIDKIIEDARRKEALVTLTEVAGVTLQKIIAYQERSQQLEGMKNVVDAIGAEGNPLPVILGEAVRLFGADSGSISIYQPESNERVLEALWRDDELLTGEKLRQQAEKAGVMQRFGAHQGVTGRAQRTGQVQRVGDVSQDTDYLPIHTGTRSEMAVPLINAQGEGIGVLNLESRRLAAFSPEDEELSRPLGHLVSAAIEKNRLFERTQQMNLQLESLHQVVQEQGLESAVERILVGINQLLGSEVTTSNINLYDETSDNFNLYKAQGPLREVMEMRPRPSGTGIGRYVLEQWKQPLYIQDSRTPPPGCPALTPAALENGVRSSAALPLGPKEHIFGTLFIHRTTPTVFTEDLCKMLERFAAQASVAIENALNYQRRTQDIAALQQVNEAIVSKNLPEIMGLVVEQATRVMQAHFGQLWLIDEKSGDLLLSAQYPPSPDEQEPRRLKLEQDSINTWVARQRQPRIVQDASQETDFLRINLTNSSVTVPLIYRQRLVGTLNVESKQLNAFSEREAALLSSFAGQAAVAIATARAFERRLQYLEALREINSAIGVKQPDEVNRLIAKKACELTGATSCTLWSKDEPNKQLKLEAMFGESGFDQPPPGGSVFPLDHHSINAHVAITRRPYLCNDVSKDERYYPWNAQIRSSLTVPVKVGPRLIGTLDVESIRPAAFDESQMELLASLGEQFAIAQHNARAYQQRITDITALQDINKAIGSQSLKDIYTLIAQKATELTGGTYSVLWLLDPSGERLELQACEGREWVEDVMDIKDNTINAHVVRTRSAYLCNNTHSDPYYYAWYEDIRSSLVAPIFYGDKLIGTLDVESTELNAFTEDQRDLLQSLGNQAAIALENARLVEAYRQRAVELARLNQAGQLVGANLDRQAVLQTVMEQAQALFEATGASVWFIDAGTGDLICEKAIGPGQETVTGWRLPGGQGIASWVAEHGQGQVIFDANQDARHYKKVDEEIQLDMRAILSTPLRLGARILGTLQVVDTQPGKFNPEQLALLEPLAGFAAVSLENARIHSVQAIIAKIVQGMVSGVEQSEEQILELIRQWAGELMDVNNMYIAFYDALKDQVWFPLAYVDGQRVDEAAKEQGQPWAPRRSGQGRTEHIIHTKEALLTRTEAEAKAWYKEKIHKEYIGQEFASWVGAPMLYGDDQKVLGVIATYHKSEEHKYSRKDVLTLRQMADQVAIALQNNRLVTDLQQQNRIQAIIAQIVHTMISGVERGEEAILELVHQWAGELMDVDNMFIAFHDAQQDRIWFPLAYLDGSRVDTASAKGWGPRRSGQGRTEHIIHTRAPLLTRTKTEAQVWYQEKMHKEYIGQEFASWVGVPMLYGDETLGVIATYHKLEEHKYSQRDILILQQMANQVAVAVHNARLVTNLQQQNVINMHLVQQLDQRVKELHTAQKQLEKHVEELDEIQKLGEALSMAALPDPEA